MIYLATYTIMRKIGFDIHIMYVCIYDQIVSSYNCLRKTVKCKEEKFS